MYFGRISSRVHNITSMLFYSLENGLANKNIRSIYNQCLIFCGMTPCEINFIKNLIHCVSQFL